MSIDPYLDPIKTMRRLEKEYYRHGKLVVAYDFDNTVYDNHNKGYEFDMVIELLRLAKELGCYLIVFTCSDESRHDFIREYLSDNEIPFDSINENCPDTKFTNNGKIYYNILLDDRAGLKESYVNLKLVLQKIKIGRDINEKYHS